MLLLLLLLKTAQSQRCAAIAMAMDESGSMDEEQSWIADPAVINTVFRGLERAGFNTGNVLCVTGFAASFDSPRSLGCSFFTSSMSFTSTFNSWVVDGSTEDGYLGIDFAIDTTDAYLASEASAIQQRCSDVVKMVILITDEARDPVDFSLSFESLNAKLSADSWILNSVLSASTSDIGVGADGSLYRNGSSGNNAYIRDPAGTVDTTSYMELLEGGFDYAELTWFSGGVVWNLGVLRSESPEAAAAFSDAFIDVKVTEVVLAPRSNPTINEESHGDGPSIVVEDATEGGDGVGTLFNVAIAGSIAASTTSSAPSGLAVSAFYVVGFALIGQLSAVKKSSTPAGAFTRGLSRSYRWTLLQWGDLVKDKKNKDDDDDDDPAPAMVNLTRLENTLGNLRRLDDNHRFLRDTSLDDNHRILRDTSWSARRCKVRRFADVVLTVLVLFFAALFVHTCLYAATVGLKYAAAGEKISFSTTDEARNIVADDAILWPRTLWPFAPFMVIAVTLVAGQSLALSVCWERTRAFLAFLTVLKSSFNLDRPRFSDSRVVRQKLIILVETIFCFFIFNFLVFGFSDFFKIEFLFKIIKLNNLINFLREPH